MNRLLAPLRILYHIYALVLFITLMFIVIPFVIIGSLFGKIRGGNFVYRVCTIWADIWMFMVGIRHRNIYLSPLSRSRQYIFVANHISYMDAPVIVKTIRIPVRVLGKEEMARIPVFGYIYRNAIVTVNRKSPEQRAKSVRILKSVLRKNISIFMFPEGTFNETNLPLKEFFDGAFRIAIETQTPIRPVLFLDTYDRLHYRSVFSLTPGRSRSVFLEEISVEGFTMKDVAALRENVFRSMDSALRSYGASWINN